jgi:chromosome segregation ATPase
MPGDQDTSKDDEEEYELLSHDKVQQLREEAHHGEGDLTEAVHEIRHVKNSIEDFTGLLESVKDNILEDYAESPNPEKLLNELQDQNKKIAEAVINVTKKVNAVADNQQTILDELASAQQKIDDIDVADNEGVYGDSHTEAPKANTGTDEDVEELFDDMDDEAQDLPPPDKDEDGFFDNILGS